MDLEISTSGIDENATQLVKLPLLLPHEVFGGLSRQGQQRWQKSMIGQPGQCVAFWQHTFANSAWAAQHPLNAQFQNGTVIPIGLYGESATPRKTVCVS